MTLSANADNMGNSFQRMSDINIRTIPLNPFDLIAVNRWQVCTYHLFSQILKMGEIEMQQQISPRAFSFYSFEKSAFVIVYNSEQPPDRIQFNLAHEIGHIFYGHVSEHIPLMLREDSNKLLRDKLADEFARFILQLK